ncbi:MAG: hypothetical protein PHY73_06050 [Candidatus Omnitrophica bacterium]|nr:hypothetical protein [Candidatus Omnitrophota bacterium]
MSDIKEEMLWDVKIQKKYEEMISKIPLFHREIINQVVPIKSQDNAKQRGSSVIEEKDVVSAFLTEVPKAFYSLMIRLMDEVGFDYKELISNGSKK